MLLKQLILFESNPSFLISSPSSRAIPPSSTPIPPLNSSSPFLSLRYLSTGAVSLEVWGTPATDDASSYALSAAIAVPGPAVAETPERLKRYRALSIVQRGSTTPGGGVGGGHGESGFSGGSSPAAPRSAMRLFVGVDVLEMGSEATGVFGEGAVTEAVGPSGGGGATGPMVPVDITAAASTLGGIEIRGWRR